MFIKVDNIYYCVNTAKFTGSEQVIANKVIAEVLSRMNIKSLSRHERNKIRSNIFKQYLIAKAS